MATTALQTKTITLEDYKAELLLMHACNIPTWLWGPPGVGKSDVYRWLAKELGFQLIDMRASQMDAVDTRGCPLVCTEDVIDEDGNIVPGASQKITDWAIPKEFPRDPNTEAIWLLDELANAPLLVQVAFYQLILDRRLGQYELPAKVYMCAASNREDDGTGVRNPPSALVDRFANYTLTSKPEEIAPGWLIWAKANGIHSTLIAYFDSHRTNMLEPINVKARGWTTPRSVAKLSDVMHQLDKQGEALRVVTAASLIGPGVGSEIVAYVKQRVEMPTYQEILMDATNAKLSKDPAIQLSTVQMITAQVAGATTAECESIGDYIVRLGEEVTKRALFEMTPLNKGIVESAALIAWLPDHHHLFPNTP